LLWDTFECKWQGHGVRPSCLPLERDKKTRPKWLKRAWPISLALAWKVWSLQFGFFHSYLSLAVWARLARLCMWAFIIEPKIWMIRGGEFLSCIGVSHPQWFNVQFTYVHTYFSSTKKPSMFFVCWPCLPRQGYCV
jgi:hypothetical protein